MFDAMLSGNLFAISNVRRAISNARGFPASLPAPPASDDGLAQDLELDDAMERDGRR